MAKSKTRGTITLNEEDKEEIVALANRIPALQIYDGNFTKISQWIFREWRAMQRGAKILPSQVELSFDEWGEELVVLHWQAILKWLKDNAEKSELESLLKKLVDSATGKGKLRRIEIEAIAHITDSNPDELIAIFCKEGIVNGNGH